ncbi:MAG TPA: ferritin-like domain-containing protein [Chitinophagaceae bacterium]|nr:ferritin-like domain-containing protein [Chitinophagaceae bacterium]
MEEVKKARATQKGNHSQLREFFLDELKDIYWAEKHLIGVLPKMEKAATTSELKAAFSGHLQETKKHVIRLEQAFRDLGEKPVAKTCEAMKGITREGETIISETGTHSLTRDVGLIFAGQKTEHYEIATYGGLIQVAKTLGLDQIANLFEATLSEEKHADSMLTDLAEDHINESAMAEKES